MYINIYNIILNCNDYVTYNFVDIFNLIYKFYIILSIIINKRILVQKRTYVVNGLSALAFSFAIFAISFALFQKSSDNNIIVMK